MGKITKAEYGTLNRAAELLEQEAKCLHESCTNAAGLWDDLDALEAYDEMMEVSKEVRLFLVRRIA